MKKNESIPNRRIRWLPTQLLNYSNRPACGLSTAEQTGTLFSHLMVVCISSYCNAVLSWFFLVARLRVSMGECTI